MFSMILFFLFFMGFIIGLKRGFILQAIHLTSFFIAFFIAVMYYKDLAVRLTLWIPYPTISDNDTLQLILGAVNAEQAFYRGIAFFIIFFAVKIVLQIIGSMLDFVARFPIIRQLNAWAGGILGFLEIYLISFLILYMMALIPIGKVQTWIDQSWVAKAVIEHTPILSQQLYQMWF